MEFKCPGSANMSTPTLEIRKCPNCGAEIELFSTDIKAQCYKCGFTAYNDKQSCIQWCKHAEECVGKELYAKLVNIKTQ